MKNQSLIIITGPPTFVDNVFLFNTVLFFVDYMNTCKDHSVHNVNSRRFKQTFGGSEML